MENTYQKVCPKCNTPMNYVKAGVSKKTNEPYPAFYTCPVCKPYKRSENPPQSQSGASTSEIMTGLRKLWLKLDEMETQVLDKGLQFDDFKEEIKKLLKGEEVKDSEIPVVEADGKGTYTSK